MSRVARACLAGALVALPTAALLAILAQLGLAGAWAAMVHLMLFGWITGMILAINYHTVPMFAARDFPYPALGSAHVLSWCCGVVLYCAALLTGWGAGALAGLAIQLLAALLFAANTVLLFTRGAARANRPPVPPIAGQPQVDRVGTQATRGAGMALPLALLLLLLEQLGLLGGEWRLAAEHLVTLGWIMLMIVGVAYHVLPRFSGTGTRGLVWARVQLACHYSALLLIVLGLGLGWPWVFAIGAALMALALALFAWAIWPTLRFQLALSR